MGTTGVQLRWDDRRRLALWAMLVALMVTSVQPAFNSFFGDVERRRVQTAEALSLLGRWAGPGVLVVVTHQVNITALTGQGASSGEGVIIKPTKGGLQLLGTIRP